MACKEVGQRRRDQQARDAAGHVDLEPAAHAAVRGLELLLHVFHVGHQRAGPLEQHLAVGREAHAARGAVQQARAQAGLELLDGGRDGGARKRQPVGGAREAAGFSHAQEDLEEFDAVHGGGADCS
ncbi:hypothetical protein D3C72_1609720 [compost metagenome]